MSFKIGIEEMSLIHKLVGEGFSNKQIAAQIGCHNDSVKRAITRMKRAGFIMPPRKMGRPKLS
jgi:transposase